MPSSLFDDDAVQELDSPTRVVGVDRGGLGASFSTLGPGFAFQSAMGAAFESVLSNTLLGTIDVASYATAGAGTLASPWTGWEIAFPAGSLGSYKAYYFRAGYFATAGVSLRGRAQIRVYGAGAGASRVTSTAAAKVFNCGPTGSTGYAFGVVFDNLWIHGGGLATDGIYWESVHHSTMRNVKITDVVTYSFYQKFGVANTFDNVRITGNESDQTQLPAYGMYFTRRDAAESSTLATIIGGHIDQTTTAGIYCDYLSGALLLNATVEGNFGKGVVISANCAKNLAIGLHLEANTGNDAEVAGYSNELHGTFCDGNIVWSASRGFVSGDVNTLAVSGNFNIVSVVYALTMGGALTDTGIENDRRKSGPSLTLTTAVDADRFHGNSVLRTSNGVDGSGFDPGYSEFIRRRYNQIGPTPVSLSSTVYPTSKPWRVIFSGYWADVSTGPGLALQPHVREVNNVVPSFVVGARTVTVSQTVGGVMQVAADAIYTGFVGTVEIIVGNYATGHSTTSAVWRGQTESAGSVIRGATSGSTTVVATAVAGTTTLTLPAATDTLVGKATTDLFSNKTFVAGTGAGTYKAQGPLNITSTSVATGNNTTETDGWSFSVPGATLAVDGYALRATFYVQYAGNANGKTVQAKFGSAAVTCNVTTAAPNGVVGEFTFIVMRTGAATQTLLARGTVGTAAQNVQFTTATETLSGAVTFKVTMTNGTASANDIILRGGVLEILQ